jgi:glyoxylase-like metal-dependent hydrolase (beta-lactamase superfamily II)
MEIANGIFMLKASPQSHVFLIRGRENILVDTGLPGAGKRILAELASMGTAAGTIKKILLTHHDVDHIGNLKMLGEATGARIFAPEQDIPFITGERSRPGVKKLIGFFIRPGVPGGIIPYGMEELEGIRVIHAPGHTPGHMILLYKNVLFAGDLLQTTKEAPAPMANFMNEDSTLAAKSISLLKTLDFDWICPAHGNPLRAEDLREFLKDY